MRIRGRSGQTAVEYVLALCAMMVVVAVTGWLLSAARSNVVRTEALVGSDYP